MRFRFIAAIPELNRRNSLMRDSLNIQTTPS